MNFNVNVAVYAWKEFIFLVAAPASGMFTSTSTYISIYILKLNESPLKAIKAESRNFNPLDESTGREII
jgi:hypothetical protein